MLLYKHEVKKQKTKNEGLKKMSDTINNKEKELVQSYVRNLDTNELIDLWETLTNEVNNPSVMWDMEFFLEEYLPDCVSSKAMNVLDLANILTANDHYVKHFSINDQFVYTNSLGLWESINEYDIKNLVIEFINNYDCVEYSETIKNKLAELKEDANKE